MNRNIGALFILHSVLVGAAAGQRAVLTTGPSPQEAVSTVRLAVRPADAPKPALKYLLLPDVCDQTPGNAAQLYYTAQQLYADAKKDELDEKIDSWCRMPLNDLPRAEVRRVLSEYTAALRYVRLASRSELCHWDIPVRTEAFNVVLPQLGAFRGLAKIVAVQARLNISEGNYADAMDDLQTGFAMARHIGEAPTLINALVGLAVGGLMLDGAQDLMQAPDAPNLYWALADLPRPFIDMRNALRWEKALVHLAVPQLRNLTRADLTPQQWNAVMKNVQEIVAMGAVSSAETGWQSRLEMAAVSIKLYPKAKRYLMELGQSKEQVERMPVQQVVLMYSLDRYTYWRDEMFKWLSLPYWQAHEPLKQQEMAFAKSQGGALADGFPFTMLLPSLRRAYFRATKCDRHVAALQCIEAVRMHAAAHDGRPPASLGDIHVVPVPNDPVTGKAFGYEVKGNVVTLDAPPPAGDSPRDGAKYVITIIR